MSKFVKLPSGLVVNLDRIDLVAENYLSDRGDSTHIIYQSSDAHKDGGYWIDHSDACALFAAMGVK